VIPERADIVARPAVEAQSAVPLLPPPSPTVARPLDGVSIVLPCLDEEANVADAVRGATRAAERVALEHEVIVVDDGSTDETAAIVAGLAARDQRVRLLIHAHNRGYGDALRTGFDAACMPWVFLTDADMQFDLAELEGFVPLAEEADLVIGWRIMRRDPLNRRINAAAWNWLVRRMFKLPFRDVDCAFKLIRRDVLTSLELTSGGATISTELLLKALVAGARVREIGVHHRPRVAGEQSGARPRVVARAFRELASLHHACRTNALPKGR
jgi:glycosyltransferase involved in cell wall biosynthesis